MGAVRPDVSEGPTSLQLRPGVAPPDPFRWNTRPHLRRAYRVAGFNVLLETNDERILAAADVAFNPQALPVATSQPPDFQVQLMHSHSQDDPEWQLRVPIVRTNGQMVTVAYSRHSSIAIDVPSARGFGFLTEPIINQPMYMRTDVVFAAVMCWVYVATNGFVHAAGLVRDGRSFLLRGPSGAGKSTLTYALLRRGYSLISEDALYVYSRSAPMSRVITPEDAGYFGVPWQMHLLPDAVRFFPELAGSPCVPRSNGEVKIVVDIAQQFPNQACPEANVGPLVFLTKSGRSASCIRRLTPDEGLERLRATSFSYEPSGTEAGSLWAMFLQQPLFALESGNNPNEAAGVLDAALVQEFTNSNQTP
ncbi:MAG: hypothetical protein DCC58_14175 [Chloroflexi bacterium]|nr:MAG: hypothetical protein DCC58_14175 [Chloroflexota bacterium]